jgi:hypothetical protein
MHNSFKNASLDPTLSLLVPLYKGGKSFDIIREGTPAREIYHEPLKT